MPREWVSGLASCQAKGVSTRNPIAAMPNQSDVRNRPGSRACRSMSDLIRHARAGLGGLRAGGGETSSTPGSDLLSLDIDFASCRAGSCAALSRDPRGHPYFLSFLFFSYFIGYKNATAICAASRRRRWPRQRMSPKEHNKPCHPLLHVLPQLRISFNLPHPP